MSEVISSVGKERNVLQGGYVAWAYCRANGLFVPLNCDANGNLGVSGAAGGTVAIDQTTPGTTNAVTDAGFAKATSFGVANERVTSPDASSENIPVTEAPAGVQKLVIVDIEVSVESAMRVDLLEENTGFVIASKWMAANSTVNLVTRAKRKLSGVNNRLLLQTSGAGNVSVGAFYYSEA